MNKDNVKNKRTVCVILTLIVIASTVSGFYVFYRGHMKSEESSSCLFDGWVYGREDQKRASEALVAAGLTDFSWRAGQLFAPTDKLPIYHSALASAGAYPKAPSELRAEALREMSVFESDAKSRMREMNACVLQLERTIEQMRGIEYATVGARSRREQSGLTYKTVITATVGVALDESRDLDSDVLSAITVATKHHLGIDDVNNISIIDLKGGKSYLGIENSVSTNSEVALSAEKKRVEQYWRDKYIEAFGDVKNIRISVSADIVWQTSETSSPLGGSSEVEQTDVGTADDHSQRLISSTSALLPSSSLCAAHTSGRFETLGRDRSTIGTHPQDVVDYDSKSTDVAFASQAYATCGADQNSSSVGVARLGNPRRSRERHGNQDVSPLWAQEDVHNPRAYNGGKATIVPPQPLLLKTSHHNDAAFPVISLDVASELADLGAPTQGALDASRAEDVKEENDNSGDRLIRQTNAETPVKTDNFSESKARENAFFIRSLYARIAIPRSYILQAALPKISVSERSDLRLDSILNNSFYIATEEKILAETKRFAVDLLRPTSKRFGWTEDNLDEWVVVVAYSDATNLARLAQFQSDEALVSVSKRHSSSYAPRLQTPPEQDFTDIQQSTCENGLEANKPNASTTILTQDNTEMRPTFVADTQGNLTTVSPTAASSVDDAETSEASDETTVAPNATGQTWMTQAYVREIITKIGQPGMERNIAVAFVAGVVFLWALLRTTRKKSRRQDSLPDEESEVKAHDRPFRQDSARTNSEQTERTTNENVGHVSATRSVASSSKGRLYSGWEEEETEQYEDELEDALQSIAESKLRSTPPTRRANVATRNTSSDERSQGSEKESSDYWRKREEALKLIARYPERAAASLQSWVTDPES